MNQNGDGIATPENSFSADSFDGVIGSPEDHVFRSAPVMRYRQKLAVLDELSIKMDGFDFEREAKSSPAIPTRLRLSGDDSINRQWNFGISLFIVCDVTVLSFVDPRLLGSCIMGIGIRTDLHDKVPFFTLLVRRISTGHSVFRVCHFGPKAELFLSDKDVACTINDPGTTRLHWSSFPQSVLVVKKARDREVLEPFVQLLHCLLKKEMTVFVEQSVLHEEHLSKIQEFATMKNRLSTFSEDCATLNDKIDFIICLGGDGTLLYASSLFQTSVPPVMAFHLGSLGFLTPFEFVNFEKRIECVLRGHANLTLRSRLHTAIAKRRPNQLMNGSAYSPEPEIDGDDPTFVVLNDVVIDRGPSSYLVNIDLFVDGRLITSVQGDGLIISTPTGSTAYAVAAGAAIIHPGVPSIMITPICPHSLSFRPIVIPAGCDLRVMVSENARDTAWVSFDGRNRQKLGQGDVLRITTSIYPLPSICQSEQMHDWFNGLAGCLHWNVRKPQKPLDDE